MLEVFQINSSEPCSRLNTEKGAGKCPLLSRSYCLFPKILRMYIIVPCSIKDYAMKAYGGVDVQIHTFLTSVLVGGQW
jgi:hypothetical protein